MLQRLKNIFAAPEAAIAAPSADHLHIAAAALLVHAASIDGHIAAREQDLLTRITGTHFGLTADEAAFLLAQARQAENEANDLYRFTAQINAQFSPEHKITLFELLWQIVLADGKIDDYEANLLRRLAGLLYVSDKDVGAARQRAIAKTDQRADKEPL